MTTELRVRIGAALGRDRVRANIRRAMDGLVVKRRKAFPDEDERERLRDQGAAIRAGALASLPDLREGLERTEKRSGVKVSDLRIAGGGSQSNAAMQLTADVFGLPCARPHVAEASGLGAAIDAAVGLGLHPGCALPRPRSSPSILPPVPNPPARPGTGSAP